MSSTRSLSPAKPLLLAGLLIVLSGCDSKTSTASLPSAGGAAIFGLNPKSKGLNFHVDHLPAKLIPLDSDTGLVLQITPPRKASYFATFKKSDGPMANAVLSEVGDYTLDVVRLDTVSCQVKLVYEK